MTRRHGKLIQRMRDVTSEQNIVKNEEENEPKNKILDKNTAEFIEITDSLVKKIYIILKSQLFTGRLHAHSQFFLKIKFLLKY